MEVATAVTGKERGDLHVGKRGVFFFHDGMECSAEVVDILNNEIEYENILSSQIKGRAGQVIGGGFASMALSKGNCGIESY